MEYILPAFSAILTLFIIPIIGYFLKKIHARVESTSEDITSMKLQMAGMGTEFSKNISSAFNELCKERQGHCGELQQSKFAALEAGDKLTCSKIHTLEVNRKEDWAEQKIWNAKIEVFLADIKKELRMELRNDLKAVVKHVVSRVKN